MNFYYWVVHFLNIVAKLPFQSIPGINFSKLELLIKHLIKNYANFLIWFLSTYFFHLMSKKCTFAITLYDNFYCHLQSTTAILNLKLHYKCIHFLRKMSTILLHTTRQFFIVNSVFLLNVILTYNMFEIQYTLLIKNKLIIYINTINTSHQWPILNLCVEVYFF